MEKTWHRFDINPAIVEQLQEDTNLHPLMALFLVNRGIKDMDEAHSFLYPTLQDLPSPFLFKDMEKACVRLTEAVRNHESILVYGDYDTDGITATAILWLFLKKLGARVFYYIPDRISEGYGLKIEVLQRLFEQYKLNLVITVDCGISNHEPVAFARRCGVDVIITDHHLVPSRLPEAFAVINPKQKGCLFPDKDLAGVGVAFNFLMALRRKLFHESNRPNLKSYLDLVALGTIADMVPLRGENRILVSEGLKVIGDSGRPGIAALKARSGLRSEKITSYDVGFRLAPRLNAAGRIGSADDAFRLLTTEDPSEAEALALKLDQINVKRQGIEEEIFLEILGRISEDILGKEKALIFASSKWHRGVLGIVASRLAVKYNRPAILFSVEGDVARGSGRSGADIDLHEVLTACVEFLEEFGGHREAAGLSLRQENLPGFKNQFLSLVAEKLSTGDLLPKLWLESSVNLATLRERSFLNDFLRMPPFGNGNPSPTLDTRPVRVLEQRVVAERHTRIKIHQHGHIWEAIGFNMLPFPDLESQDAVLAFALDTNHYQGRETLQLRIVDLKTT